MIKLMGLGERDGREIKMVVLGLSHLLRDNRPIMINGEDVGLPDVQIIIFCGTDERTMQRDFADLIGPKTRLTIDPRFKD